MHGLLSMSSSSMNHPWLHWRTSFFSHISVPGALSGLYIKPVMFGEGDSTIGEREQQRRRN